MVARLRPCLKLLPKVDTIKMHTSVKPETNPPKVCLFSPRQRKRWVPNVVALVTPLMMPIGWMLPVYPSVMVTLIATWLYPTALTVNGDGAIGRGRRNNPYAI